MVSGQLKSVRQWFETVGWFGPPKPQGGKGAILAALCRSAATGEGAKDTLREFEACQAERATGSFDGSTNAKIICHGYEPANAVG